MANSAQPILLLHGLGESADVWEDVKSRLPGKELIAPEIRDLCGAWDNFTLARAADALAGQINEPVDVVGLSLGAVLAIELALRYPEKVSSLFLSAPQVRPPQALMSIQKLAMRVLPERVVCPPEMTKPELLAVLDQIATIDNTVAVSQIDVPTTVVVGSKDKANLKSSATIADLIPGARYIVVDGVGHQWSTSHPDKFADSLKAT